MTLIYWVLCRPNGGGLWVVGPAYISGRNIWKFYNVSFHLELDTNSDPTFTVKRQTNDHEMCLYDGSGGLQLTFLRKRSHFESNRGPQLTFKMLDLYLHQSNNRTTTTGTITRVVVQPGFLNILLYPRKKFCHSCVDSRQFWVLTKNEILL